MEENIQKLKAAYEMLQKTNEKLHQTVKAFQIAAEESNSLVFTYYADKQMILVDEKTAKAFQVQEVQTGVPYEMVKRGIVSEDTQDEYIRIHEAIMRGEKEASGIVKLIAVGREEVVYELKLRAIVEKDGASSRTAVGIYRDITKRYQEERDQERYRQTVFSSDRFTFQYDIRRDVFTVYTALGEEGSREEKYESPGFQKRLENGEICPEKYIADLRKLFSEGTRKPVRVPFYRKDKKELCWYSLTASVLRERGSASRVFGTLWDVTDLREREGTHEKLERVLLSLKEEYIGIFEVDLEQDFFSVLHLEGAMVELPEKGCYSETLRRVAEQMAAPEYRESFRRFADISFLKEALSKERRMETEYRTTNAANAWRRTMFQAVQYQDGVPVKVIIYQQDVDRLKMENLRQQQALQEAYHDAEAANSAKTEFLSRMSHDIRTPMNAIIGMTAIAETNLDDKQKVAECLEKISVSSRHLLSLINEVLDMSKIESGKMELQEEEFNLADMIDDTITMVLPEINQHQHKLSVSMEDLKNEWVIGDCLRLQQAFVNLITNSVKYTPDGGRLSLHVREKEAPRSDYREYEFVFEDNGIGMSEEFQKVLFVPFSRAEDSRLSKVAGTGLGMSITRSMIRMMDGNIEVRSSLGEGTSFCVSVPLRIPKRRDESFEELKDLSVLVVDDDKDTCESTGAILNELGMRGEWCLSGRRALELIKERHENRDDYFAIVVDWKMPEMDGMETAKEIRRAVGTELPIILISGYDWSDIEAEAREVGISHFLAKPLFRSRLISRFKELLSAAREEKAEATLFEERMDFSGRRILLAEDNELNAEIAMEILKMTYVEADWAENGKEAVERIEASPEGYYDMVFMDIQMPVMNGYEAARAIRELPRKDTGQIPIIAMTANAFTEDVRQAKQAGMNEHISKPIDFGHLGRILRQYLRKNV